jgi:hypothetical protein
MDEDADMAMEDEFVDSQTGMEKSWEGNGMRSDKSFEADIVGKGLDAIVNV